MTEVLKQPATNHFIVEFADRFLPAWVRLCWALETVSSVGYDTASIVVRQEEHIPWSHRGQDRPDLRCAAEFLVTENLDRYDFASFPGALFNEETGALVVLIPAWTTLNTMRGLAYLEKSYNGNFGLVSSLYYYPVGLGDVPPTAEVAGAIEAALKSTFSIRKIERAQGL